MLKKLTSAILLILVTSLFTLNTFALSVDSDVYSSKSIILERLQGDDETENLNNVIYGSNASTTSQFLVTITRPEGDETTFSKSYVLCGFTDASDVRISIAVYDEEKKAYRNLLNTDGTSSWDVGDSGVFSKEVALSQGANKIKIVAYKKSEIENLRLGKNLQVNTFTVTVLNPSLKDVIMNNILKINDIFNNIKGM